MKMMCYITLPHTTNGYRIPTAAFNGYSPKVIYLHIIKTDSPKFLHEICHCTHNGSNNCSVINTLGPVYPGQMLQMLECYVVPADSSKLIHKITQVTALKFYKNTSAFITLQPECSRPTKNSI